MSEDMAVILIVLAIIVTPQVISYFVWRRRDGLKPCPFCGYEKPVVEVDEGYPRRAWVECPRCEAKGPTESIPYGMTEEEAAVDAWNDASRRYA